MDNKTVYIIYHIADFDGRGSAAIINNFYKNKEGFNLINIPINNIEIPSDYKEWDKDAIVYMSDISFPKREQMEYMLNTYGDNFIWNDHHISSMNICKGLEINGFRRIDYAGIHLTWFWFNKDKFINIESATFPKSVNFLGCKDIRKTLELSEEFEDGMLLHTELYDPTNPDWEKVLNDDEKTISSILNEGKVITKYRNGIEKEAGKEIIHFVEFEGYKVPAINTYFFKQEPFMHSKDGNLYENSPMVIIYYRLDGAWKISMRSSKNNDIDLSVIAKKYGGGGHKKASAMRVKELPFKYI